MIKNLTVCLLVLLAVFSQLSFSEMNKKELVIEYLELSKTKETFDASIKAYVGQLSRLNPDVNKEELTMELNNIMGWEAVKESSILIIMKHFTAEELKDINSFYKSKAGSAFAAKAPIIAVELSNLMAENMKKVMVQGK